MFSSARIAHVNELIVLPSLPGLCLGMSAETYLHQIQPRWYVDLVANIPVSEKYETVLH